MIRISIVLLAAALGSSCNKKEDTGGAAASGGAPAAGGGGGDKSAATKLPTLGLTIDVPGEVTVADGIGAGSVMLTGSGIGAMQIEVAKTPSSAAAAAEDAKMYSPTNMQTEIVPPNGFVMTFENKGGAGTNYWVTAQREINGKTYTCGTTGSDPAQAKAVKFACKSLR